MELTNDKQIENKRGRTVGCFTERYQSQLSYKDHERCIKFRRSPSVCNQRTDLRLLHARVRPGGHDGNARRFGALYLADSGSLGGDGLHLKSCIFGVLFTGVDMVATNLSTKITTLWSIPDFYPSM